MNQEQKKAIGGLYKKTSKKGLEFLTGFVELNGQKVEVVAFANTKKFSETSPDFSIYQSQPYEGGQGGQRSDARAPQDRERLAAKVALLDDDDDADFLPH